MPFVVEVTAFAKLIVVGFLGLVLALFLGTLIGQSSWLLPATLAAIGIVSFLYLIFFRSTRPETVILASLIFGYIVGNRGFAQVSLGGQNSPLFIGEVGLAVCLALMAVRLAVARERPVPNTPLAWAIIGFLAIGGVRLYLDAVIGLSRSSPVTALRDSAAVYYAAFFFIAYRVGQQESERQLVHRWTMAACVLLLPIAVVQLLAPDAFNAVTFRGVPVIFQKGDLLTCYLAFSSYYFFFQPARGLAKFALNVASLVALALMLTFSSRAALVGFALCAGLLLIAHRPRFLLWQFAAVCAALIFMGLVKLADVNEGSGAVTRLSDKIQSMTDITGTGHYRGETGEISAANNQFRLVWWQTVFDETMEKGPWFGLGFGDDLTRKFLQRYYLGRGESYVRSPHSMAVTMFGRMGWIGLTSFVAVAAVAAAGAIRAAARVRRGTAALPTLAPWMAAAILLGASMFGVVLEGPMGGILFWSFLGLAASQPRGESAPAPKAVPVRAGRPEETLEPALAYAQRAPARFRRSEPQPRRLR